MAGDSRDGLGMYSLQRPSGPAMEQVSAHRAEGCDDGLPNEGVPEAVVGWLLYKKLASHRLVEGVDGLDLASPCGTADEIEVEVRADNCASLEDLPGSRLKLPQASLDGLLHGVGKRHFVEGGEILRQLTRLQKHTQRLQEEERIASRGPMESAREGGSARTGTCHTDFPDGEKLAITL
jgi:hypothetical protein